MIDRQVFIKFTDLYIPTCMTYHWPYILLKIGVYVKTGYSKKLLPSMLIPRDCYKFTNQHTVMVGQATQIRLNN